MSEPAFDYRAARAAVFASSLPGTLRLLVLALIEWMPNCRPSIATLACQCGVERKTVLRGLARLEQLNVLAVERATGARSQYTLQPVPLWRTGPIESPVPVNDTGTASGPVPTKHGTGPIHGTGPVPSSPKTGPTMGPKAEKADPESSLKRSVRAAFDAPTIAQRFEQFPAGWRWSAETEAEAMAQMVTAAELQEHVNYWSTHAWTVPVTDLDAELRRSIPGIRIRAQKERAKARGQAVPGLRQVAPRPGDDLDTTGAATAFRLNFEHRDFAERHLPPTVNLDALAHEYRSSALNKLVGPQRDRDFLQRLMFLAKHGRFVPDGELPKPKHEPREATA